MQWIQHKRDYSVVQIFYLPGFLVSYDWVKYLIRNRGLGTTDGNGENVKFQKKLAFQHGVNMSGNIAAILEMISIIMCTFYTHCIVLRPRSMFGNY